MSKVTNQQAYQWLTEKHIHWDRKSPNEIVVWTLGYKTAACYEIEEFLMQAGMVAMKMDFDKICGKTYTIYKHKQEETQNDDLTYGTIGNGKAVHIIEESTNSCGKSFLFTVCGTDHATNRSVRSIKPVSVNQPTCKKCLKLLRRVGEG